MVPGQHDELELARARAAANVSRAGAIHGRDLRGRAQCSTIPEEHLRDKKTGGSQQPPIDQACAGRRLRGTVCAGEVSGVSKTAPTEKQSIYPPPL